MVWARWPLETSLYEHGLTIGESKVHLKSDTKAAITVAEVEIRRHRQELTDYIREHPDFQYALEPVEVPSEAPRVVRIMAGASRKASVGPMAAVAGALADLALEAMRKSGAKTAVVEDGGEIAVFTDQPITIEVLSSSLELSGKFGFCITREDCPIGIATSSSKTGHAISFGEADSVTVVADDAALADAAATAVCNSVVGVDIEKSIQKGLEKTKAIKGVRGAIITREGHAGLTGKLPKIIKIKE